MLRSPQPYEELDHTADVGVRVRGASAEEALARLVCVLGQLLLGDEAIAQRELTVSIEGGPLDIVAVDLLRELLYRFTTERIAPVACAIEQLDSERVVAHVGVARYEPGAQTPGTDIKAVTYHEAELAERDGAWTAQVVFDV